MIMAPWPGDAEVTLSALVKVCQCMPTIWMAVSTEMLIPAPYCITKHEECRSTTSSRKVCLAKLMDL
jgi:hypothetical protein